MAREHLHEDRLHAHYVAERTGEPLAPPDLEHLADCCECAARYEELSRWLDGLRAEGEAEVDAIFTPERLWHQQQQIARRLEHVGRSARVISFPGRVGRQMVVATTRVAPRWLAAAAAAGLFIGVAVGGWFFDAGAHRHVQMRSVAGNPPAAFRHGPAPLIHAGGSVLSPSNDEELFLLELDLALERPNTRELLPLDALTPHVREVSTQGR